MPLVDCDPNVQHFLEWLGASTRSSQRDVNDSFISAKDLELYFQKFTLESLLVAVFSGEDIPVDPNRIRKEYIKVFSILLSLGQAQLIERFSRYPTLSDSNLPFPSGQVPKEFPKDADDGGLYEKFCRKQWRFCVPVLHGDDVNVCFEEERILPIISKERISSSRSATVYKIILHSLYNNLHSNIKIARDFNESANTFALKTYHNTKNDCLNIQDEIDALQKLRYNGVSHPDIIGFYASYQQNGAYNMILEYADRGNLEEYFINTPPPETSQDILHFWKGILRIINAFAAIHSDARTETTDSHGNNGWYRSVKPQNILVVTADSVNPYRSRFKVADYGICNLDRETLDMGVIEGGRETARAYDAPECCQIMNDTNPSLACTNQNIVIWSVGAVLSEAAVWVVLGMVGLREYRKRRRLEVSHIPGLEGGEYFHDGNFALAAVSEYHEIILQTRRSCDHVTKEIVTGLVRDMLDVDDIRPTISAATLRYKRIIDRVEEFLKIAETNSENMSKRWSDSTISKPNTPPQVLVSLAMDMDLDRISEYEDFSSQGGHKHSPRPESPSSLWEEPTLDPFAQSPLDRRIQEIRPIAPLQIRGMPASSHIRTVSDPFNGPKSRSHSTVHGTTPTTRHSSAFQFRHGPTPSHEYSTISSGLNSSENYIDGLQPRGGPVWINPSSELARNSSRRMHDFDAHPAMTGYSPSTPPTTLHHNQATFADQMIPYYGKKRRPLSSNILNVQNLPHAPPGLAHLSTINTTNPYSIGQYSGHINSPISPVQPLESALIPEQPLISHQKLTDREVPRPPFLSVAEADKWLEEKKKKGGSKALQEERYMQEIKKRDHVFLIDDAESMKDYWHSDAGGLIHLFRLLAYMVKRTDPDGIELYFSMLNAKPKREKNTSPLVQFIQRRNPAGLSNMGQKLGEILNPYEAQLENWADRKDRRSFFNGVSSTSSQLRPLNLYILTDAIWQPHCDVESPLRSLVSKLEKLELPKAQVGIQFIRFGNDPYGCQRLQRLDEELGLSRDIVDTEPADGNIWKMLLGATNKWFDNDDQFSREVAKKPEGPISELPVPTFSISLNPPKFDDKI